MTLGTLSPTQPDRPERAPVRAIRRDIEGLRAVAVTLVVALHAGLPLAAGFVGVDIFFVISGYLMTALLMREAIARGTISISGFYARRAKRLLPAAATVLVTVGVATLLLVPRIRWPDIGRDIAASALYVQNWRLAAVATDYNTEGLAKSPLQHFWSLAVEEQFYIVWPLLLLGAVMLAVRRRPAGPSRRLTIAVSLALLAVAVPSFLWSMIMTADNPRAAYFVTTTRLWELALGGAVAIAAPLLIHRVGPVVAWFAGWAGAALLAASVLVIDAQTPFPGSVALLPTGGTALVIAAGLVAHRRGPAAILGLRPFQWIGKLSYSLYLWHWPLLVVVAAALGRSLTVAEGVTVVLASLIPAYLSFRWVEDPVRRSRCLASSRERMLQMGLATSLVGLSAGVMVLAAAWPPATPPAPLAVSLKQAAGGDGDQDTQVGALVLAGRPLGDPAGKPVSSVSSITPDPLIAVDDNSGAECIKRADEVDITPCIEGDAASEITVALVGDSHAAQWFAPLALVSRDRGWQLSIYAKQNCTYAAGVTVGYDGRPYTQCAEWSKSVAAELADSPPDLVIVSDVFRQVSDDGDLSSYADSFDPLVEGYQASWQAFLRAGADVVVLHDTPRPEIDVPACAEENFRALDECAVDRAIAVRWGTPLEAAARSTDGVRLIDLSNAICPTASCAPVIGGVLVYRDTNHLTATYALTLAPRLDRFLPRPK